MSSLAVNGGTKAVTVKPKENWKEPPGPKGKSACVSNDR